MSLLVKFNVILVIVFALALVPAGYVSHDLLHKSARTQVIQNARIMMQTALATRTYTNKQIKPLLAPRLAEEFLPQSVPRTRRRRSSTTCGRTTRSTPTRKRRSPDESARPDRGLGGRHRERVSVGPELKEIIGERDGPLGRSLYLATRSRSPIPGASRATRRRTRRPASVVKAYGTTGGFGWKLNEIIGAQLVAVPMAVPVAMAKSASKTLIATLVGVFAVTLLILNVLLSAFVIRPLKKLAQTADKVSTGDLEVPDVVVKGTDEVALLAGSFTRMRISLTKALKMLENE